MDFIRVQNTPCFSWDFDFKIWFVKANFFGDPLPNPTSPPYLVKNERPLVWRGFKKVLPRVYGIWTVRLHNSSFSRDGRATAQAEEGRAQMILICKGLEIKSWSSGRTSVFNDAKNNFANTREKNLQRLLCWRQNAICLLGTEWSAVRN